MTRGEHVTRRCRAAGAAAAALRKRVRRAARRVSRQAGARTDCADARSTASPQSDASPGSCRQRMRVGRDDGRKPRNIQRLRSPAARVAGCAREAIARAGGHVHQRGWPALITSAASVAFKSGQASRSRFDSAATCARSAGKKHSVTISGAPCRSNARSSEPPAHAAASRRLHARRASAAQMPRGHAPAGDQRRTRDAAIAVQQFGERPRAQAQRGLPRTDARGERRDAVRGDERHGIDRQDDLAQQHRRAHARSQRGVLVGPRQRPRLHA